MKANDVKIDSTYMAALSGELPIYVRVMATKPAGGWSAINVDTGKKVTIPAARALKHEVFLPPDEANATTNETIAAAKPARQRQTKVAANETDAPPAKLSQLDAAVKVLGEATEPLTTKEMVEAMTAKRYWSSPGGKTPHATLYSAILRELQNKGDASRFVKTDRGHFQLRSA